MPELPDVEVFRDYTEKHALRKEIASVQINDSKILDMQEADLKKEVEGKSFTKTARVGKQMFIKYDDSKWLTMHFGMTGHPAYFEKEEEAPDYSQLLFKYKNGHFFSFVCPRKFGKIGFTASLENFITENDLGKDALEIDFDEFREVLEGRRGKIKSTLMKQNLIAGIGNIYSDEILFQCKIHPEKKVNELDEKTLKEIYNAMRRILKTAINNGANPSELPQDYLIPNREEGKDCPKCEGKIEKIDVSGRGTYLCSECQKI